MDVGAYFKGKKITVMGLGLLGRGVGDAEFLASQGALLTITDLKSKEELADSLDKLKAFSTITYTLGEHRLEDFEQADFVLKAAGVPLDSPYIAHAKKHGIPVKMSATWFMELSGVKTIGVTGTRGKSTTTYMIYDALKESGAKVLLGGNIRGVSTLALLRDVTPKHTAVLELDSWQCQGFRHGTVRPDIAVFTTFFPDHLNYYKDDLELYLSDKAELFLHQTEKDTLVLGAQAAPIVLETYGEQIESKIQIGDEHTFPEELALTVPGEHNRYDAGLALLALRAHGLQDEESLRALALFKGAPGRLELIREVDGVRYYNDTNATTPEATIAALKALGAPGRMNIALIMGGADKGLSLDTLLDLVPDYTRHVSLLAGTGTERTRDVLFEASVFESLEDAFADANSHVGPGDIVLMSPAFASFGMFKNEYDRGDQFNALVSSL